MVDASHLHQTAPTLRVKGAIVHEVTSLGSVTNQQEVNRAKSEILKKRDGKDVAVVLDLTANNAYRCNRPLLSYTAGARSTRP